ncbi:MAG: thioredoxin [Alphaproteobacteria bacterium]
MEVINDNNFETEVLKSDKPVLVDFFATWCGPCRQMLPIVTELSEELADKIKIVKMDVDEAPKTPSDYEIQSIPTLILFKDGKVLDQKTGAMPKSQIIEWIHSKI